MVFASLSPNHTSFDSASLHSSQASVRSAPSLHSSSTFVAPNSRRASRTPKKSKQQVLAQPFDFVNDLYQAAPSAAVSTVSLNAAAVRPPRVEYAPPVPPTALDFLQSSPPTLETPLPENIAPPASRRTPTPRSTTSSSAMPRPKTSDGFSSSNSRGSVKKVLSAFGFSSNKKTPTPAPVVQHAVRSTLVEQAPAPRPQRIKAVADVVRDQTKDAARKAMAYVKRKLNSKTPEEELPKTWEEYSHVYARVSFLPSRRGLRGRGRSSCRSRSLTSTLLFLLIRTASTSMTLLFLLFASPHPAPNPLLSKLASG